MLQSSSTQRSWRTLLRNYRRYKPGWPDIGLPGRAASSRIGKTGGAGAAIPHFA